jgi:outer membrane protein
MINFILPFITLIYPDYNELVYFCHMQAKLFILSVSMIFMINTESSGQQKWDLRRCVDYAMANNITVKQTGITAKVSELNYRQSKKSQIPNANLSLGPSFNNGRNQDPTNYSLITQNYFAGSAQLQSSVDIFNFYSKKHTIAANELEMKAANANTDKLKDDIALTVANSYLQILLTKEQEKIALIQLQQSQAQYFNTRKLVNAGSLPELNAAELESQVARDSSNYITAKGNVQQSILNLKAYMSLDAGTSFEIEKPPVELIPVENITDLQPEVVYTLAVANLPQQKYNDFKLKAAYKNNNATRAGMLPTLSGYLSLASQYNSRANEVVGIAAPPKIGTVNVSGTDYKVYSLYPGEVYDKTKFTRQLDENFRQAVGISLTVPILSGGSLRTNWEKSKLNIKTLELQKDADNLKLKQDIYQAYNLATTALEKFNASKKSVETAQRVYDFSQKRYAVGMLSTIELITNQNDLLKAKLEFVQNQFDYVFKMKVLEFYKGQGLKL